MIASDSNVNTRRIMNASLAGTTVASLRLQTGSYTYLSRSTLSLTSTAITRNTSPHIIGFRRNGTAITGFYGQNVPYPGFAHHSGFVASTVIIVVLSVALYAVFRRNDWL